ncbi:MarR family transcriptional regulator [uncultured Kordia sp.]|uniref:MarR family winged helix-turn-helix transcriptional regulator n=1 Tax=uncultured Kordia sp. TaxID=507699 RepID=UPI002611AA37|nr:MarR family transcriptional regulator [uncultured Kordia sp.]
MNSFREQSPTYQIALTRIIILKEFKRHLKENGLKITPEQLELLNVLFEKNNRSMQEITTITKKDNSATTRMVDILEKQLFVKRKQSKTDRRLKLICITEKGTIEVTKANKVAKIFIDNATKDIAKSEIDIFLSVINKIKQNIS